MNILQILPEMNVGGVETGTLDLAGSLVKLGHRSVVVSGGGALVKELEAGGTVHYALPVHKKSILSLWKMVPELVKIIEKEKIDIVHARSRAPAWIAYAACRRTKTAFVTTCHGYYSTHPFSRVMGWGKRVIVPSNVIGRHMIEDFNVPHERIRFIPRSVDLEKFRYTSLDEKKGQFFNVGIIGRITPLKGHGYFIKSMAKVIRSIPHLKIWIVGDTPGSKAAYKEQLQVLVKRLGLWHCTEFLGTQRDIPEVMKHLDLVALATTTQEAFGRVVIEAQACGVPVVATSVGGVIDIIEDKKTGLLVAAADPESMAEAVLAIAQDKGFARRMAENAYKRVKEKYSVERMVKSTLEVYKEALEDKKVLIIKFSSLGDIILSTAAIRAIHEKFVAQKNTGSQSAPNTISFLVQEEFKDILLPCPYIGELLIADFKDRDKSLAGFLKLVSALRKRNFDIVIDLQNNRKSHLLARLTLAPDRYGYDNKKLGFLLNHRIPDDKPPLDPVSHQFRILKMLGVELKDPRLELWPAPQDERFVDEFLESEWMSSHHMIVGINVSASTRWKTKVWPMQHVVKVCEELSRRDIRVVLTGTQDDLPQASELLAQVKNVKPMMACGKTTVMQLACLIRRCAVYISSDSAPLHVAAAVGTPFVALFGPTDPRRHLPYAKKFEVIKKELPCSPCYRSKCGREKCMESIKPEEVLAAIERLLKS